MLLGLLPTRPWLLMAPACLVIGSGGVAQAQVSAGGLGTRVNGTALGRCTGGICTVQGGTRAGQNQFYRFSQFDTRSKIKRVDLDTRGRRHVVVGVGAPNGSFFGAPVHLSEAASLFWLSPGGIWLGKGAGFSGATNLLLSTSPTMRFGGKEFDVLAATASDALRLDQGPNLDLERLAKGEANEGVLGAGVGPIVLAGGQLRVDRNLLIDSGVGTIRSELGAGPSQLAAGESLTLVGGSVAVSQASFRGSDVLIAGAGGLQLDQVWAQAATPRASGGLLQLIAGNKKTPKNSGQSGSVWIANSSLEAPDIRMRANGSIDLRNVRAVAGPPGDRGLIQMETVPGSGPAILEGANLEARRIVLRAESVAVQANSRLEAPKGMISLEARSGDLLVNSSTLDVGVHHIEDLKAEAEWRYFKEDKKTGVDLPVEISLDDPPFISLYARNDIHITGGSFLTASQDLDPLLAANSSLKRSEIRLKDTAGAVIVEAERGIALQESRLAADATHNFAGDVALRAKGKGAGSTLFIDRSEISVDGGAGGGDVRINSSSGIRIVGSELRALSHNRFENRDNRGLEIESASFPGGEITLTNASLDRPILVEDSRILVQKTSSLALVLPLKLDGIQEDFLVNSGYTADSFSGAKLGGLITLISNGGIDINGGDTKLSIASRVPGSDSLDDFPGTMRFAVAKGKKISIANHVNLDREALQNPGKDIREVFSEAGLHRNFWAGDPDQDLNPVKGEVRDEAFKRFKALQKSVDQAKSIGVAGQDPGSSRMIDVFPSSLDPFERSVRPLPLQGRMVAGPISSLTLGLLPDGRAPERSTLVAEAVEPLSEAKAAQLFADDQQRATREVVASLGIPMDRPRNLGIAPLQDHLRLSIAQPSSRGNEVALADRYVPAILHLSLTPLPDSPLVHVNQILIPAEGPIRGWQSRATGAKLKSAIETFQRRLSQMDDPEEAFAPGSELKSVLIDPVMPEIQRLGINALLLSLDRGLQGIPFAALPLGQGTLGEQIAITVTPALALTDLAAPSPVAAPRVVLAGTGFFRNGLAPLPMARQELDQLARIHPEATVMVDGQFQTRRLVETAGEGGLEILHLATHADFTRDRSGEAQVYTSDGTVSLRQIGQHLRKGREGEIGLFVLNACRTAIGDEDQELGITGLALQTGASSALGNLWYVDDAMSAAFSVQYHRFLQRGLRKDQALQFTQGMFRRGEVRVRGEDLVAGDGDVLISGLSRADQLRLMKNRNHPYFWAGTVLSGRPW